MIKVLAVLALSLSIVGCSGVVAANNSAVPQATTTLTVAASPTFSPPSGNFPTVFLVTISTTTPGATIYYSTNGVTPNPGSGGALYRGPIYVHFSETVKALATAPGMTQSPISQAVYTVGAPPPPPPPPTTEVTLNWDLSEGAAFYKLYRAPLVTIGLDDSCGTWSLVNSPVNPPAFDPVPTGTYCYSLSQVFEGVEGTMSDVAIAVVP